MRVADDEPCEVSYVRMIRIAAEIEDSLRRNLTAYDPDEVRAAARNLAMGYSDIGILDVVCPACHATETEIRATGHRRRGDRACPESCTCVPPHVSFAEHHKAMLREEHAAAEAEIAAGLGLDRDQRAIAAGELQALAQQLGREAAVARARAVACRAGAAALLAGRP